MCPGLRAPASAAPPGKPTWHGILGSWGLYPLVPRGCRDKRPVQDATRSAPLLQLSKGTRLHGTLLTPLPYLVTLLHGS